MSANPYCREAGGITVRPFALSDGAGFFVAVRAAIQELSYWMPWCSPTYALADAESWMRYCEVAWQTGSEFPLGIFDSRTGAVLGGTGLNRIDSRDHNANLGYWVSTPATGRHIARRAARMAADIGFNALGFTRLEIVVLPQNLASQRVALSLGATLECTARNKLYFHGVPRDALVFSLIPGDLSSDTGGSDDSSATQTDSRN